MKTLTEEWNEYAKACYPEGISGVQSRETRQAFFSGALCMFNLMSGLAEAFPDEQASAELEKLRQEILRQLSSGIREMFTSRRL